MDRRRFVQTGAALAVLQGFETFGASQPSDEGQMAFSPATWYRPYTSKAAREAAALTWVQIDLGAAYAIDAIRLYPALLPGYDRRRGRGFPVRWKLESSDDPSFSTGHAIVDNTQADFENPGDHIVQYPAGGMRARYVRFTATRLRAASVGYALAIGKIDVISSGRDVAERRPVTADETYGNPKDCAQVTRPARPMGEGIITDHPENVTPASQWKAVPYRAQAPVSGVQVRGEFRRAMEQNAGYLLKSFSVEEMLRPFRERAGKPVRSGLRPPIDFWDTELQGSSAGRFLMGAGNTLRWMEHADLRRWMDELIDGIAECRAPNGYIMAYPEDTILENERGGYTRAWLTHGLIEAGYAGNPKAFDLLRGFYDWFDRCKYLPKMMRGGVQGVQGMIANTRMYFTPMGKPEDIQVIQRYYQENYWLAALAKRDPRVVWQYPYDRPHNYLITDFDAYMDMYRATGDPRYHEAMEGAWELYHDNWEHTGGSIAITEFGEFPPKSYRLVTQRPFCETGELCGSTFWVRFNQHFQLLDPDREKYAGEIEKSIYNVGLANQVRSYGFIYHARLVGRKGDLQNPLCTNSCCEGQGTRLIGSLPEYIYSLAPDGIYVNLYEPSTVTWRHAGGEMTLAISGNFPYRPDVKLQVTTAAATEAKIRIRVPGWAAAPMPVHVNGAPAGTGQPGSYLTLDRRWGKGDTITFRLPMELRLTRYTGLDRIEGHERFALEYGPVLMALAGSDNAVLRAAGGRKHSDFLRQVRPDPFHPLQFLIEGHPEYVYVPYWKVLDQPFTCFPAIDVG